MEFTIPADIHRKLDELDAFIERGIKPRCRRRSAGLSSLMMGAFTR